jgi:hypothetical protein
LARLALAELYNNATDFVARPAAATKNEIRTLAMAAGHALSAVSYQASANFQLSA